MKTLGSQRAVVYLSGFTASLMLLASSASFADEQNDFLPVSSLDNSVPATIISLQDSWVSAEIAANVDNILIDVGQKVEKDGLLATLDCREYIIRKDQAQAEIDSLKAKLPGIKARIEAAKSDVAANQQSVSLFNTQAEAAKASVVASNADANRIRAQSKADQAKCRLASIDLKRARDLGKRQIISQQEVDKAETEFQSAQAECNAIKPELASAKAKTQSVQASASAAKVAIKVQQAKTKMASSNIKVEEAEIPALNAQIAAAKAMLNTETLMTSRCDLKAPFDGEIVERKVQVGQRIAIGESAFRIISLLEREISASLTEQELKSIQSAKFLYFSTPIEKLPVRLRAAVGLLDGEARTREVRFVFVDKNKGDNNGDDKSEVDKNQQERNTLPIGTSGRIVWEDKQ